MFDCLYFEIFACFFLLVYTLYFGGTRRRYHNGVNFGVGLAMLLGFYIFARRREHVGFLRLGWLSLQF